MGRFLEKGWIYGRDFNSINNKRHDKPRGAEERGPLEELREAIELCWMQLRRLLFFQASLRAFYLPALGTSREQMLRKSLPGTACCKLHDNFHTPISVPQEAGVRKFVVGSGAQGDVKTIAPTLMLAPLPFK